MKIGTEMAKGATWMVAFKLMERTLGVISTMILARILVPEDYGLIALATSLIAILELFGAFGFDMALIQNQNAERKHYDTAWTIYVIYGALVAALLMFLAVPVSNFYGDPRLIYIIRVLALGSLIQGFRNIGIVDFRKHMYFRREFIFQVSNKLVSFCVTVPAAIILKSYWALIIGMLTSKVTALVMSYIMHRYRPRFSLQAISELFNISVWLLVNSILYFLRNRSVDFIMGKTIGARELGLYRVGYEISIMPTTELSAPVNRAVFPGYAKQSHDLEILRAGVVGVMSMVALIVIPAGFGIAATAELLVPVTLGFKWMDCIPLMQIMAFYGAVTAIQSNFGYVYLVIGKPRITTFLLGGNVVLTLPLLFIVIPLFGAQGAANMLLISVLILLPINYFLLNINIKLTFQDIIKTLWRPVTGATVMYAAVRFFIRVIGTPDEFTIYVVYLLLSVLIGAFVYIALVIGLWILVKTPHGAEYEILKKLQSRISFLRFEIS